MFKACIGLNCARTIDFIDHRHCSLSFIPDDVYRNEQTLEDLLLDCNMLQELPAKFFRLTNLRKLTLSENDLMRVPPNIANLTKLVELDISKNAIEEIPTNMQFCRSLSVLDLSSNPLLRTPETLSSIASLTQLFINDVSIPSLPKDIGNLSNLRVLESRENMLKSLPMSMKNLKKLQRLDVGNNEIESLPSELGEMKDLVELWLDDNSILTLPPSIVQLTGLVVLDITKNKVELLPPDFSKLTSLSDLHASENCIEELPDDFGDLQSLHLVKLDYNHLRELPESIGKLEHVTELLLYDNMLESLPDSLFHMKSLEMLNVDRNHLSEIPNTVGDCRTLHVLSLRENELTELPASLGQLEELTVLDVVGNRLNHLPLSVSDLHLDALWIDNSQSQPLIALHPDSDSDKSVSKKLTCAFLPQQGPYSPSLENFMEGDSMSESQSLTNSLPRDLEKSTSSGKAVRLGVAFDPSAGPGDVESSKLVRFPTPFRRDMNKKKKKLTKYKPDATPSAPIFKKGSSQDDLLSSMSSSIHEASPEAESNTQIKSSTDSLEVVTMSLDRGSNGTPDREIRHTSPGLAKMSGMENLASTEELSNSKDASDNSTSEVLKDAEYSYATDIPGTSQLQTVEVVIELVKQPGRTLGFSIAGGRGSTPAYEDVDESIFVTKIANGGLAEQDGRLRLGDKLLKVNSVGMENATHTEAVTVLKNMKEVCTLVVSREVLVVMPDESADSRTATPTPGNQDQEANPAAPEDQTTPTEPAEPPGKEAGDEKMGQNFAKRIVAEILDRSVAKYRDSLVVEGGEEEGGNLGPPAGAKSNYVNYDIAQTVIVTSREAEREGTPNSEGAPGSEEAPAGGETVPEEREGSRTPTEANSSITGPDERATVFPRIVLPTTSIDLVETSFNDDDYPTEKVVLDRSVGKLGLSIIGGSEHATRIFGGGRPGVYVSKITPGGAAHASDKLRLGDRILAVNGQNVRHSSHHQVVQWLIAQKGNIELLVEHVPQPTGLQVVVIKKSASAKLGISIKGGTKSSTGNPLDPNDKGIFISKISAGASAEKDGRLKVGLRVLEVNGTSLLGATHLIAVRALRNNPMEVSLLVCEGFDPREVVRRKSMEQHTRSGSTRSATLDTSSLSSEASRSFDDAVRILSESMDALPTVPQASVHLSTKLSHSSAAIIDQKPVTADDLDDVLKGLAKFNMENPSKSTPDSSTPVAVSESPLPPPPADFTINLTSELYSLQSGEQLPLGLLGDETPTLSKSDRVTGLDDDEVVKEEKEEDEFSELQVEDSSSYLDQLDSEVSHLKDEVLEQEGKLEDEVEEGEKKKPKGRRLSSQRSMPRIPVAEATVKLTPETQRRIMEEIEISIDSPKNETQKKEAVDSLIGEVFDDVSFDEFEEENMPSGRSSGRISGSLTPDTKRLSANLDPSSSANMNELLSALSAVGSQPGSRVIAAPAVTGVSLVAETQPTNNVVKLDAAPPVSTVTLRAATNEGKSKTLTPNSNTVLLRAEPGDRDPEKRKSAPPKVAEKPTRVDPDKLSFKEKLALHKKTLEEQAGSPPVRPPARPSSAAREGFKRPATPELGVDRPSDQATTHPSSGDAPSLTEEQLSAEERRLNRIVNRPAKYQVSSTANSTTHKQNGESPSVKTTTIHLTPTPVHSSPPSINTNSNNSHGSSAAVPATAHAAVECKQRGVHREQREKQPRRDVNRVHSLISKVAADSQDKPSSDTL